MFDISLLLTLSFSFCFYSSFSIVIWGILTQKKPYQGKTCIVVGLVHETKKCSFKTDWKLFFYESHSCQEYKIMKSLESQI